MFDNLEQQLNKTKSDFVNYILALKEKNYAISVSFVDKIIPTVSPELRDLETHTPKVCDYLKSNPKYRKLCIINKTKLLISGKSKLFYGCCHAGIEEFVFPVKAENNLIAYINLSGFRSKSDRSIKRYKKTARYAGEIYESLYAELSCSPPSDNFVRSFLTPFSYILEKLYLISKQIVEQKNFNPSPYRDLYVKILNLLYENFTDNDCTKAIAEKLGYSISHIRYVFKNQNGTSLYNFILTLKLKKAENLLKNSSIPITLVSDLSGFNDSNYFSTVYKKVYGVSPEKYRKL